MKRIFYWVEIPTEDFDRAVDFYSKLLNVKLEKLDFETEKNGLPSTRCRSYYLGSRFQTIERRSTSEFELRNQYR